MILHVLKANKTITASDLRTLSNAIVNAHTSIYKLFESVESYLNHIDIDLPDPKDVVFYEVVMEQRASTQSWLVTGNIKHFPNETFIVTPRQMLDIILNEDMD